MSNSLKIIVRTLLIILFMSGGAWLNSYMDNSPESGGILAFGSSIVMYVVYFLIGIVLGTMINPRFTKNKNKIIYLLPALIFIIIGSAPLLYYFIPMLTFPWIGNNLSQFSFLSWTLTGVFSSLLFR
jgi:hypothetical protein